MHRSFRALLLFSAASFTSANVVNPDTADNNPVQDIIPNQYIIEYTHDAPLSARQLAPDDSSLTILKTYNSAFFSGAAIEISPTTSNTNTNTINILSSKPHIANIWPNRRAQLHEPVNKYSLPADFLTSTSSAPLSKRSSSFSSFESAVRATSYSTHNTTRVSALHAAGITGQNVKIGIVDCGVYYNHVSLGSGFGSGHKVAGGWDFVGSADPSNFETKLPDADPAPESLEFGHGTHVAGIAAGRGPGGDSGDGGGGGDEFVGVAPDATIMAYKVTGRVGTGTDDATLIDAFLKAEEDGCDVISASYGSASGWDDGAWATVARRLVEQAGIVVVVSAGNNGAAGPFMGVSAGSADGVLAVGSVQAEVAPGTGFLLTYIAADGSREVVESGYVSDDWISGDVKGWEVVDMGTADPTAPPGDACEPFPAGSRNLTTAIPLVRRGGCSFQQKQTNLLALGAKYVLMYNDDRAIEPAGGTLPDAEMGLITQKAGKAILKAIRDDNATITADFSSVSANGKRSLVGVPDSTANTPNIFSGWAATYDLQLKPDVSAPGGNIYSTWPGADNNTYMVQSGTSMSTPYIAGLAALYISAHGGRNGPVGKNVAKDFHRRVIASGKTLPWIGNTGGSGENATFRAPPAQMGSGLVDAWRTLFANSTVDVTRMNLNDTAHFNGEHEITVTNTNVGGGSVVYDFKLEPAAGFEIQEPFYTIWNTWGIRPYKEMIPLDMIPDVQLPEPITLGPGESATVKIVFDNPGDRRGWNATLLPMYSGKVVIEGDSGDRMSVGYMGVAADLYKEKKVFQNTYPMVLSMTTYQNINDNSTYNFNISSPDMNYPGLYYTFDWGVHELRWDIFATPSWPENNWTYPPTAEKGYIGSAAPWMRSWDNNLTSLLDPEFVRSNTADTPLMGLARYGMNMPNSPSRRPWFGHYVPAGGKDLEVLGAGEYTMRVAASRPFGDLSSVEGWEVWEHEFTVVE